MVYHRIFLIKIHISSWILYDSCILSYALKSSGARAKKCRSGKRSGTMDSLKNGPKGPIQIPIT